MESISPMVQRRRLARELRQLRLDSGRTVQQVAAVLECSSGKISRIETADVGARIGDVRDLLDVYDVHGAERERILELVRQARRRTNWWYEYAGVLPQGAMRFFGLEAGAASLNEYSGNLIPGLLQAPDYTRALIGAARDHVTTDEELDRTCQLRTEVRLKRQQVLLKGAGPVMQFVLNESALAVRFGGASAMVAQLDHLLAMANQPNITIGIMPLDTDAFAAAGGMFTIFTFASEEDLPIVYLETRTFNSYLETRDEIDLYRADFRELADKAYGESDSINVIKRWADAHRVPMR